MENQAEHSIKTNKSREVLILKHLFIGNCCHRRARHMSCLSHHQNSLSRGRLTVSYKNGLDGKNYCLF